MSVKIILLIVSALASTVFGQMSLRVQHPVDLREEIGNNGKVVAHLASFGQLQYGTSFLATIYYASSSTVRQACNETEVINDVGLRQAIHSKDQGMGIMAFIEDGGNCTAPVKVRNMEKAGV